MGDRKSNRDASVWSCERFPDRTEVVFVVVVVVGFCSVFTEEEPGGSMLGSQVIQHLQSAVAGRAVRCSVLCYINKSLIPCCEEVKAVL